MVGDEYKVELNKQFGPVPTYKHYLIVYMLLYAVLIWFAISCCYIFIPEVPAEIKIGVGGGSFVLIAVLLEIWALCYFKTVKYLLNETEITWQRGVFFHKTGIVPYNRITDVTISQGPIMRLFGISNVGIQTAGGGNGKGGPEISIEGQLHATELRAIIMDHVRDIKNAGGATLGVAEPYRPAAPKSADNAEILEELRKIREILEKKN